MYKLYFIINFSFNCNNRSRASHNKVSNSSSDNSTKPSRDYDNRYAANKQLLSNGSADKHREVKYCICCRIKNTSKFKLSSNPDDLNTVLALAFNRIKNWVNNKCVQFV